MFLKCLRVDEHIFIHEVRLYCPWKCDLFIVQESKEGGYLGAPRPMLPCVTFYNNNLKKKLNYYTYTTITKSISISSNSKKKTCKHILGYTNSRTKNNSNHPFHLALSSRNICFV